MKNTKQLLEKNCEESKNSNEDGEIDLNLTEEITNYYFRVNIENVFYQNLVLHTLRKHFKLDLSIQEEEYFAKKALHNKNPNVDLKQLLLAKEKYMNAPEELKKKWLQERESLIVYKDPKKNSAKIDPMTTKGRKSTKARLANLKL